MQDYFERPYRPCVGIMLLNADNHVLVGQRLDNMVEAWQMPQGGIDDGETPIEAGFREMGEEIGTTKAEFIAEHPAWLDYDIPVELADRLWKGKFRGQTQKWLLFRFTGEDSDINIATAEPEFQKWKWAEPKVLPSLAVPFKRDVYEGILAEFADLL
ncbi:MAG: RNA pyrophosphohydrolase [Alphaproteobacteria bacterium]|nr:RNA pyrophosphohydrolase [Alphaproteobacteria bacterium]